MTIKALIRIVAPPKKPLEAPKATAWKKLEKELGTALPADYKALVATYGTGCFDDFIWLANPFSTLMPWKPWFERSKAALPAGLWPWASSENGNFFCFRTDGEPDAWPVVVGEGRGPRFDELPGTATAALAALLSKKHRSPYLRESFPPNRHRFAVFVDVHKTSVAIKLDKRPFADRLSLVKKHAGKVKVEQSYADEAVLSVPGTSIRLTYRDCDEEDDGREGAELFACYASADEAEVRRIVRATVAEARWKLGATVDFKSKQPRWDGGP